MRVLPLHEVARVVFLAEHGDEPRGCARGAAADPSGRRLASKRVGDQRPVTANHAPVGEVTKTIGAKHGEGSATDVSRCPSPRGVTGKSPVATLSVVAVPFVVVRQLTIAPS
jgi:hypothetical protein